MSVDANELVKVVADAAKPVVETLGDTWNAVVGDRVAAYRLRNAAKLQPRVEAELARLGLKMNPAKIPERYAVAWFEEATKQDEPQIQDLFARLLANAAAGHEDALDRRLLEIVTRLTPADATIFTYVYDKDPNGRLRSNEGKPVSDFDIGEYDLFKALKDKFGERSWISIEHLIALGALEKRHSIGGASFEDMLRSLSADERGHVHYYSAGINEPEVLAFIGSTGLGRALHTALAR